MLKAKDIMSHHVVTVSPETGIVEVARILLEKRWNGLPVVDSGGRLVGVICQSDLIAQQKKIPLPSVFNLLDTLIPIFSPAKIEKEFEKISATTADGAMTPDPVTVTPETSLEEVAALMVNEGFHTVPVVEGGKLVGVIGKEDILRTLMPAS
jgi:CBS-domain-containing membrane protein